VFDITKIFIENVGYCLDGVFDLQGNLLRKKNRIFIPSTEICFPNPDFQKVCLQKTPQNKQLKILPG